MILFSQQVADRPSVSRTIERLYKLLKPHREKIIAQLPVMLHSRRSDVVLEKTAPSLPDLFVHHAVDVMKMDRLECLEKLIGRMKKAGLLFCRQGRQIFKTDSPDAGEVSVLSKRSGYLTKRRRGGVLRRQLCHAGTAMHLNGEIKNRENH